MLTLPMTSSHIFLDALSCAQRSAEIPEADDIFGWLIGSWEVDAMLHRANGLVTRRRGEVHAAWVLEGRAIQDLFIIPRRAERHAGVHLTDDRYGTTIRTYDRSLHIWHVLFVNPAAAETNAHLVARRDGNGISMEGRLSESNTPVRWHYVNLTPTSFHYTAVKRRGADSWEVYLELFGRRINVRM